ncbi:MAG: hypothetical protein V7739_17785 [Motiliproteus sp.]
MGIVCAGILTTEPDGTASCDVDWVTEIAFDLTPITTLTDMLDILFTFDPELFGIVLFGCATLFSVGWGAGIVVRNLSRGV